MRSTPPLSLAMRRVALLAEHTGSFKLSDLAGLAVTAMPPDEAAQLIGAKYETARQKLAAAGELPPPVLLKIGVDEMNQWVRCDFALALLRAAREDDDLVAYLEEALGESEPAAAVKELLDELSIEAEDHLKAIDPQAQDFFTMMDGAYCYAGFDETLHRIEIDDESIPQLKAFVAWAHEHLSDSLAEAPRGRLCASTPK